MLYQVYQWQGIGHLKSARLKMRLLKVAVFLNAAPQSVAVVINVWVAIQNCVAENIWMGYIKVTLLCILEEPSLINAKGCGK
jgi:hypothetical protein